MGDTLGQGPDPRWQPDQEEFDKRLEEIRRALSQGANEAQTRLKQVMNRASEYWQQAQNAPTTPPTPPPSGSTEEQRLRLLINRWGEENWQVVRDLGTYMTVRAVERSEVWEISVQTRWETRVLDTTTEAYTGRQSSSLQPLLPVWDYEQPEVTNLKSPTTRTPLEGLNEVLSCTACNGSGRSLCINCNGRGWTVCPECQGRTKKRCTTCKGRGYVADWYQSEKKPLLKRTAEGFATGMGERVSGLFEGIRQSGVPIPNPVDTDPANKGRTVPCPDCVQGEVDCSCGTGKRVCASCQGARMELCQHCNGTGKVVRHRELVRSFDLRSQTQILGESAIPAQKLYDADGDLVYNAEITEPLYADAVPDAVPVDVWKAAVLLAQSEATQQTRPGAPTSASQVAQDSTRATLQVMELVRIPYIKLDYSFSNQDYTVYIYDSEGKEKFYSDRYPTRWDKVEQFIRSVSSELIGSPSTSPSSTDPISNSAGYRGNTDTRPNHNNPYRVRIEVPPEETSGADENDSTR